MRLHPGIFGQEQQPVTIKAVLVDDHNQTNTICWDYADDPLPARPFNSYADLLENEKEVKRQGTNRSGVGPDHVCDLWLCLDDPVTYKRTYFVVTHPKESPTAWCVRADDTDGSTFPSSYSMLKAGESIHRLVYDAQQSGSRQVDMTSTLCRSNKCQATLLVDLEHSSIYGLTAVIQSDDFVISNSIYLDQTVVQPLDKTTKE
jgi:hypothetical protein